MEPNKIPCRQAFTEKLLELAKNDPQIIAVTSDARGSVTLNKFADTLPQQFIEVGIAEQNAIGVSAGLALSGKKPFVCGPACFYSARSYEQVKVDVAYSKTNVKIIGVSGGVSYGALGSTHHSLNDIAVMRVLPDMTVLLPCDNYQTRKMTEMLTRHAGPVFVRMGRGAVPDVYTDHHPEFTIGKANMLKDGNDLTIIGTGETVYHCLQAGKELEQVGIKTRVIDMHTIKPLDKEIIEKAALETGKIITVEEHHVFGGLGSAVAEFVSQNCPVPIKILGFPDENAEHGNSKELFRYYGIDTEGIVKETKEFLTAKALRK
ncbi:MAG: transketolase family protein [Bacteroidales bacterium]|nr:transketolase family protein [Bacteroidales bacterium]